MTYNVFGGTLSLTQSINQSISRRYLDKRWSRRCGRDRAIAGVRPCRPGETAQFLDAGLICGGGGLERVASFENFKNFLLSRIHIF